jgi:hypothetical protein
VKSKARNRLLILGAIFGLFGVLMLLRSFAATGTQRFEAENATVSKAVECTDAKASGGDYVKLAQSCTSVAPTPSPGGGSADYDVYFGYADGNYNGWGTLPDPWKNSNNVVFVGRDGNQCCTATGDTVYGWDGGAIRVANNTNSAMTVYVKVENMELCSRDWQQQSVPAGYSVIFTSTKVVQNQGDTETWDTSDSDWMCRSIAETTNCNNRVRGTVRITVNGQERVIQDSRGILSADASPRSTAKGGDSTCNGDTGTPGFEFTPWTKVSARQALKVIG